MIVLCLWVQGICHNFCEIFDITSNFECKIILKKLGADDFFADINNLQKLTFKKQEKEQKYSTREYTRCTMCGRPHAVLKKYGICRVCFREMAHKGEIPGVKKSSW